MREILRVSLSSSLALGIASLLLAAPSPAQAAAPDLVVLGANVDESSPAAVGTYYYGACVDGVPGESDRANNCSESVEVQVLAQGDGTGGGGPVRPTATGVQVVSDPGADGRYLAGEEVEVEVRFSVRIQVDRFASLTLAKPSWS